MQDRRVHVNWAQFNVPTILTIIAMGVGGVVYVNDLKNAVEKGEGHRVESAVTNERNFTELRAQLTPIAETTANLNYRVGQTEGGLKAVNERIDRLAENLLKSVEALRQETATLTTEVRVMGSKLDAIVDENARARERSRARLSDTPTELR